MANAVFTAVAARVLEQMGPRTMNMPAHLWAAKVQWAITSAEGQKTMLTNEASLPVQPVFGVSVLKAEQKCKEYKRKRS